MHFQMPYGIRSNHVFNHVNIFLVSFPWWLRYMLWVRTSGDQFSHKQWFVEKHNDQMIRSACHASVWFSIVKVRLKCESDHKLMLHRSNHLVVVWGELIARSSLSKYALQPSWKSDEENVHITFAFHSGKPVRNLEVARGRPKWGQWVESILAQLEGLSSVASIAASAFKLH